MPDIEGYEKNFPFEVIRLREKNPFDLDIKDISEQSWQYQSIFTHSQNNYDMNYYCMKLGIEKIKDKDFDIYIGYGSWGSSFKDLGTTFCKMVKNEMPSIKTMTLVWDYYGGDKEFDSDYMLNPAPHHYIRNHNWPIRNDDNYILIPKQNTFEGIGVFDYQEWISRPYDFVFNNFLPHKGMETVYQIAKTLKYKRFLLKKGNWGVNMDLQRFENLSNVDIIVERVDSMEEDFFRKGRYLLYPSLYEGFGLMPLEAAMQGTIPLCSDIDILRYSSEPFSIFVYSEHITNDLYNVIREEGQIHLLNHHGLAQDWINKIIDLENNSQYVKEKYNDLKLVESFVDKRYWNSMKKFFEIIQ